MAEDIASTNVLAWQQDRKEAVLEPTGEEEKCRKTRSDRWTQVRSLRASSFVARNWDLSLSAVKPLEDLGMQ